MATLSLAVPTLEEIETWDPAERQRILAELSPRIVEPYVPHIPHPPQGVFLRQLCPEAFYGGAAGGGKSDALLMAALQYVDVPGYAALLLRRSFPDLSLPGALMSRATEWLGATDAKWSSGASTINGKLVPGRSWIFPSGATLTFGYVASHADVEQYRSAEFQSIGIDELTQWELRTYLFLFSRIRRPSNIADLGAAPDGTTIADVPLRMRSASNPGGVGHLWVKERFVDEATRESAAVFVPALLDDNPSLDRDAYVQSLNHLGPVDRERLLRGDWEVVEEGAMFQRWWFKTIDRHAVPAGAKWVRYWDLAATAKETTGPRKHNDPDWTVGALVAMSHGVFYIADIVRTRSSPMEVERLMRATAEADGVGVTIAIEQEPGAQGKSYMDSLRRNVLVGFHIKTDKKTLDKVMAAQPVSSAAEAGNMMIVAGQWNKVFLDEAEVFPRPGVHDDQVDAVSGAVRYLSGAGRGRLIV